jgi:hypothetical protein
MKYLRVRKSRTAIAEARGQFESPEEGDCPPLEAVTIKLVKTLLTLKNN